MGVTEATGVAETAANSRCAATSRTPAVASDPTTISAQTHGMAAGTATATTTARQRSVLPNGPPLRRLAPAPAAASEANVGSVAASAATNTQITGHDSQCRPGPPRWAAQTANPANISRSETRSPISLSTNPHGRETLRARATAPSRLAPASRTASNSTERGHQPTAMVIAAAPAPAMPMTVNTSGEVPRAAARSMTTRSLRVYQGLSA